VAAEEGEGAAPAVEGTEWVQVESTAVEAVGFNEEEGGITVLWHNGTESSFAGDRQTFESLTGAGSVGKAVNALMRG
jgi:hypothetical protein